MPYVGLSGAFRNVFQFPSVSSLSSRIRSSSRLSRSFLQLIPILAMLLTQATASHAKPHGKTNAPVTGIVMHGVYGFGQQIIYISPDGVRIQYPVAGLNLVCKKPTYEIVWFNPPAKTMMRETIAQFRERTAMPPKELDLSRARSAAVKFAGVDANCFTVRRNEDSDSIGLPKFASRDKSRLSTSNFFVMKGTDTAPEYIRFLDTFFGMPYFGGLPLALKHNLSDGTTSTAFRVDRVEKKILPPDILDVPRGFRLVHNQPQVAQGPGYKKQFEDLARDMGLGKAFGK